MKVGMKLDSVKQKGCTMMYKKYIYIQIYLYIYIFRYTYIYLSLCFCRAFI